MTHSTQAENEGSRTAPAPTIIEAELVEPSQSGLASPCTSCGSPLEANARFCPACGLPLDEEKPSALRKGTDQSIGAMPNHTFECKNCGSQVATSVDQRSYVCPFCDSSYVTEIAKRVSGRQRPEFVIGFAITREQAQEKYFKWLKKNSWFRPGDLAAKAVSERQKGVYLPFWHFSMDAQSRWAARIGEYWYRTETYTTRDSKGKTVTRTRQVRETEWFPLQGQHRHYYSGFLVPATVGVSIKEAAAIQPFQLTSLSRYRPFFLAGWMAEEYSIEKKEAILEAKKEFANREREAVRRFLPGDTSSNLQVSSHFEVTGSDLILLPIHVLSYRYRDQVFRFLVNGQTGKVVGEKPISKQRIAILVAFLVIVLIAVVLAFVFLSR